MTEKKVEDIYKKKDMHQHVLDRPDSYIGSISTTTEPRFTFDSNKIVKKIIEYNPGMIKIFDEILVNAMDQSVRNNSCDTIKVDIDKKIGMISVFNNGSDIPIVKHQEHKIYIPELIFGNLLTSSNYNDSEKRIVGGTNGLGSKGTNIFSSLFTVEIVDSVRKLHYYQEFSENMFKKTEPVIKKSKEKSFVKISFIPDFKRLGPLTDDNINLMKKRVYDCSLCTNDHVKVFFNDTLIKEKDLTKYTTLYTDSKFVFENFIDGDLKWEIAATFNDSYEQVSFVNGIDTFQGGKHVDHILNQITKKFMSILEAKKQTNVKNSFIKDRLFLFVKSTVINPRFSSQTKEYLTTNYSQFGIKIELSDKFLTKLSKTGIIEDLMSFVKYKNEKVLKKGVNTNRKTNLDVPKLDDANFAGTSKSRKCTLLLTEGDSAKTFAISGLEIIGRDYYGVFPLKGKLLNVREATQSQLLKNEEINNLKKILGLQHGKKYDSVESLRYGQIMLLTDSDVDGYHISGLFMNFLHTWWPELMEIENFLVSMRPPLIKVFNTSTGKTLKEFFTKQSYDIWKKNNNPPNIRVKYYKGLGTSTASEAKEIFKKFNENIITYQSSSIKNTKDSMLLAFEKKKADDRKEWLKKFSITENLEETGTNVTFNNFINKILVQFSLADVSRSIPSVIDGLKPSQRKILYTLLTKNYKEEIKVSQLGGDVAKFTNYLHGEVSLSSTIVNMAQDYTGSNNINLLKPNGQFGCLDPNTEVLLMDGTIKMSKNIKIGDTLVGDDGTSRKVLQLTQGVDTMYRITLDNNDTFIANSEHMLTFECPLHKKVKWDNNRMKWIFIYFEKTINKIVFVDIVDPKDNDPWAKDEEINVNCYARKLFSKINSCQTFDIKVCDYIKMELNSKMFLYAKRNDSTIHFKNKKLLHNQDSYDYGKDINEDTNEIILSRKISNVFCRKRILRGFVETNEKYILNNTMYVNVEKLNKQVIKDIAFISNSIGWYCQVGKNELIFKGSFVEIYKETKIHPIKTLNPYYHKVDVEYLGSGNFVGWETDGNHRFLLGNFVVTHNSRLQNGKDSASPRYIFTELNDITDKIFKKIDSNILNYIEEENVFVEPEYYVPTVPMILVNGTHGIGTGFSTTVPSFNIKDIIENMKLSINNKPMKEMIPYYSGFTGKIEKESDSINKYNVYGIFTRKNNDEIVITELPIGTSTEDYIKFLKESSEIGTFIKSYSNNSTDSRVTLNVTLVPGTLSKEQKSALKQLKLVTHISTNNMHLFDKDNKIKKYNCANEILEDYLKTRLHYNKKRKVYILDELNKDIKVLDSRRKFIQLVVESKIIIYKQSKVKIIEQIQSHKLEKIDSSYDYLLSLPLYSFTLEKIKELDSKMEKIKNDINTTSKKTEKSILIDDLEDVIIELKNLNKK